MWIEALTTHIDKGISLYAGHSYDLDQDTLSDIAKKNKAQERLAFRYKKISAPWDAKKDELLSRLQEYQEEANKLDVSINESFIEMEKFKTVVKGYDKDMAEFDKLSKEDQRSPLISLFIKRIRAKRALALVEVEIIDMETAESIQTRKKIEALIQKEKAKQQPADKQYHPGKDDRKK